MNHKQRITLIVGVVLFLAAVVCPPWSYYGGEYEMWWPPGVGPREGEEVKEGPVPDNPVGLRNLMQQNPKGVHLVRGLAILVIFAATVMLYLKSGSSPEEGKTQPGPVTRRFWTTCYAITVVALAVVVTLLLVFLIRAARS